MKHTHFKQNSIELSHIVKEVEANGFYATKLDEFLPEIKSREEQMYIICTIAGRAHLKVCFNLSQGLCVIER